MVTHTTSAKTTSAGAFFDSLATFWRKRWLLRYFVHRQVNRKYRKSYLGFAWAFLSPLIWVFFLTLIFSEVVGLRFRVAEGDPNLNFGLFLYCGLLPFLAFSEAANKGLNAITSNKGLVQQIVFPLELLPLANVITSLIDKLFGLAALVVVLLVFGRELHWTISLLPFILVLQLVFVLGISYFMAILGTYLPDVGEMTRPVIRGMFFVTPILWTPDRLPEYLAWIVDYNPLAYLVESYRDLILNGELPGKMATIYFTLFSVALFVVGFALFVRLKPRFADLL